MPYTHRKLGNKQCVFKKEDGSRVGCTSGSIEKYLKALYANANESISETKKPKIFTYTAYRLPTSEELKEINSCNLTSEEIMNGFKYIMIGRGVLGDKQKNMIIKGITDLSSMYPENNEYKKALINAKQLISKFVTEMKGGKADNLTVNDIADKFGVPVSQINRQINMGKKVEKEHTDSNVIAKEIAMDHLSEFPDYYTRLAKLEKEASEHLKAIQMNETTKKLIKRLIRENLK